MNNNEIPPRWYMVTKDGLATLCADEEDARSSAAEADELWPNNAPHTAVQLAPVQPAMPADADMPLITIKTLIRNYSEHCYTQGVLKEKVDDSRYMEIVDLLNNLFDRRRIEGKSNADS